VKTGFDLLRSNCKTERDCWLKLWHESPLREPFAHPAYLEAFLIGNQEAVCAIQNSTTGAVLLPLIIRRLGWSNSTLEEGYRDATTPYGYGGAYFWGKVDSEKFWDEFDAWAIENNIVTLFARLSLFPESVLPFRGKTRYVMDNIVRSLTLDEESLWMDYEHKVRKNVKKSQRSDVTIEWDLKGERLLEFESIYTTTMERREAADAYFFANSFFEDLIKGCPDSVAFVHAIKDECVISTELLLYGELYAYSFLGGTRYESFDLRPNDLIKHEIIRWCRERGKKFYVLGGGLSPDDGLMRYKHSFAPKDGRVPFYVGERVFDEHINEALIEDRKKSQPLWDPKPEYFPAYRSS